MKKLYTLLFIALATASASAQVVISQIYGGGGNQNATFTHDFIELYNRGTVAQSLNGWSVQYASQNGTNWFVTQLPNVSIQPGKYYLIQENSGGGAGVALPTADLNGNTCGCTYNTATPPAVITTGIAMAAGNGKVILSSSTTAETTANPTGAHIIDKVAYGSTSTSGFEGSGPTGTTLTSTTAALRKNSGCIDTDDNAADFVTLTPAPKNGASPTGTCAPLAVSQHSIAGLSIYPNPVTNGTLFIETAANTEKTVTIFDVLGKQVLNTVTSSNDINVSKLRAGVYVLKITEEGNTATRKLVIK